MAAFDEAQVTTLKGALAKLGEADGEATAATAAGAVKALGVRSLTECGVLAAMTDKLENDKSKEMEGARGACLLYKALVDSLGMHFEPFAVPLLPKIISVYDAK